MTRVTATNNYISVGLKYLSIVVSVASVIRVFVHFSRIEVSSWAAAFLELYRESVYPIYEYTIEWVAGLVGIFLSDFHRDILTLYVIGCGAQIRYLSYLEAQLDLATYMGVNIPMIVYRGKIAKTLYVLFWPFVITFGQAIRFIKRRFFLYLMKRSKEKVPLGTFNDLFSSRYEAAGFVRGLAQIAVIAILFLVLNAVSVDLTR